MKLLDFIFLHRNWSKDKLKFGRRLKRLFYDRLPVSLVIFPEGTTICQEAVVKSDKYADDNGLPKPKYTLVPRITGLQYALECIGEHLDGIWDLTIGYDGVPVGEYPENVFGLFNLFGYKDAPAEIHIHLRYYALSHIPYQNPEAFKKWIFKIYSEKDTMLLNFSMRKRFSGTDLASFNVAPPFLIYSLYLVIPGASLILYAAARYLYLRSFF